MNTKTNLPPFFLFASVVFWGWQSQLLWIAVGMGLVLESHHLIRSRWELSDKDFNHLVDLSSVLLVLTAVYVFSQESVSGLYTLLTWFPFILFLLVFAQHYSVAGRVPFSALFWSLRKPQRFVHENERTKRINLTPSYVVVCFVAGSVGANDFYFWGVFGFVLWALWFQRNQGYSIVLWLLLVSVSLGVALTTQYGLQQLNKTVESWVMAWLSLDWQSRDPYKQNTAIGDIGELKLSDNILFRVDTRQPVLLRETTYNRYFNGTWFSSAKLDFQPLILDDEQAIQWQTPSNNNINITLQPSQDRVILPLPNALAGLDFDLQVNAAKNPHGVIQIKEAPAYLNYYAQQGELNKQPPVAEDLGLPETETATLNHFKQTLGLDTATPQQAIKIVADFFAKDFYYSLKLNTGREKTALSHFLFSSKAGHCEYYATATALLLRLANIPTRYSSGYAVEEYSFLEETFVVRRRHAHAWVIAYVDGQWIEIDNTPADWLAQETEQADTVWTTVKDFFSWLHYVFTRWNWRETTGDNRYLLWGIVPLLIIFVWQFRRRKRHRNTQNDVIVQASTAKSSPETSPFNAIMAYLQQHGLQLQKGQTLNQGLQHLSQKDTELQQLLQQYQQQRFGKKSLSAQQQQVFEQSVVAWLKQQAIKKPSQANTEKVL